MERTAALQLLDEEASLVGRFRAELADLVFDGNSVLAVNAAMSVIRGSLFDSPAYTDLALYDRSLQLIVESDAPIRRLNGTIKLSWRKLEEWILSPDVGIKRRGFRSLVVIESEAIRVHDLLFEHLGTVGESSIMSVILDVISTYPGAVHAASLAETDLICRLTKSRYVNVRRSAARALKHFPTIEVVTSALIEQFLTQRRKFTDETREVVRAISKHALRSTACRAILKDELTKLLGRGQVKWTKRNIAFASEMLLANDQVWVRQDTACAEVVLNIARDYRTPDSIRRLAMRLFGQICSATASNVSAITQEFKVHDSSRRLAAYRAGQRLLQRCRSRSQTVQIVRDSLLEMRNALVESWDREFHAASHASRDSALGEIRNLLADMESILMAYQEFAERMSAASLADDVDGSDEDWHG